MTKTRISEFVTDKVFKEMSTLKKVVPLVPENIGDFAKQFLLKLDTASLRENPFIKTFSLSLDDLLAQLMAYNIDQISLLLLYLERVGKNLRPCYQHLLIHFEGTGFYMVLRDRVYQSAAAIGWVSEEVWHGGDEGQQISSRKEIQRLKRFN